MVTYEGPDTIGIENFALQDLPSDWRRQEAWTQAQGDAWHLAHATPLLQVPSAIVPLPDSPDLNVLINHHHPAAAQIRLRAREPFVFDPRLL